MGVETMAIIALSLKAAQAASSAYAAGHQPQPLSPRRPFDNTAVDPTAMLSQAMEGTSGLFSTLANKAAQPYQQHGYAQPVAGLSGTDTAPTPYPGIDFSPAQAVQAARDAAPPGATYDPKTGKQNSTGLAQPTRMAARASGAQASVTAPTRLNFGGGTPGAPTSGAGLSAQQRAAISLALGS